MSLDDHDYAYLLDSYLDAPDKFQSTYAHISGSADRSVKADPVAVLEEVKRRAWTCWQRPGVRLQLLVVDNQPWENVRNGDPEGWDWLMKQSGVNVVFLQVNGHFNVPDLKDALRVWPPETVPEGCETGELDWDRIDLILLDIFLGGDLPLGSQLVEGFAGRAPHAPVFLLSQLDPGLLAAAGIAARAERSFSKRAVTGILCEFKRVFDDLYGPMLWEAWCNRHNAPSGLASPAALTGLMGSLRQWHREPEILFHGYALPEMVDHAYRHTSGVWRLANTILAPVLRLEPSLLSNDERVLLCLGIWLHDVGHVGDEEFDGAAEIRCFHGSISERLALRHPEAFALGWLLDECASTCRQASHGDDRTRHRNLTSACKGSDRTGPCSLRKAALLARYHQQSAPLTARSIDRLQQARKPLTPYCRVRLDDSDGHLKEDPDAVKAAADWLRVERSLGWDGHLVRTLEDWKDERLHFVACLVRLMDALQLHQCRVGSDTRRKRLAYHLELRRQRVRAKITSIERQLLASGQPPSELRVLVQNLARLDDYYRLLGKQEKHHWLHQSVVDVELDYDVDQRSHMVVFVLDRRIVESTVDGNKKSARDWAELVWLEFIREELVTQDGCIDRVANSGRLAFLTAQGPCAYAWRFQGVERWERFESKLDTVSGVRPELADADVPAPMQSMESVRLLAEGTVDEVLALGLASAVASRLDVWQTSGSDQGVRNIRLMMAMFASRGGSATSRVLEIPEPGALLASIPLPSGASARDGLADVPLRRNWLSELEIKTERLKGDKASEVLQSTTGPVVFLASCDQLAMGLLGESDINNLLPPRTTLLLPLPGVYAPLEEGGGRIVLEGNALAATIALRRLRDQVRSRFRDASGGAVYLVPQCANDIPFERIAAARCSTLSAWSLGVLDDRKNAAARSAGGGATRQSVALHKALAVWLASALEQPGYWIECDIVASAGQAEVDVIIRRPEPDEGCAFRLLDPSAVHRDAMQEFMRDALGACDLHASALWACDLLEK